MAHLMTLAQVEPLLARPLNDAEKPRVSSWINAIEAFLVMRYGEAKVAELLDYLLVFVADSIQRRLDKKNQMAEQESAGPFSVRWSSASSKGGWFLPGELADMDDAAGLGSVRTYRTPAPAGVVSGNLTPGFSPRSAYAPDDDFDGYF